MDAMENTMVAMEGGYIVLALAVPESDEAA